MSTDETLSIIIITFNSENQIVKCLSGILCSKLGSTNYTVTVIDNNSTDGTLIKVTSNFGKEIRNKKLFLVKNNSNIGFSRAINMGISRADSDYFLLVNPDIFVENKTIKNVVSYSIHNESDITGVNMQDEYGKKTGSYFRFPNLMTALFDFTNLRKFSIDDNWHKHFYYIDDLNSSKSKDGLVDIVTGGFMLIRRRVVKKIGLFDERFFMYLEDVDFCRRAKNEGLKVAVSGECVVHVGGASSKNRDRINHLSWLGSRKKYFLKHFGLIQNLVIQAAFIFDDLVILISYFFRK